MTSDASRESNFRCNILSHSMNPVGDEVVTFDLCYERFIHPQVQKHRTSRCNSSSRAIPFKKMLEWTERDPAMPLHLGKNQKGMQSGGEVDNPEKCRNDILWLFAHTSHYCESIMKEQNLHKEVVNRYLEPWGWINEVVSFSRPSLMNFFRLRMSPDAHPNIQRLAVRMARAYRDSVPKTLNTGDWHLPYVREEDWWEAASIGDGREAIQYVLTWSVARCAWNSYRTVDGKDATFERAKIRHDDCISLAHPTPLEHQYRARDDHGRNGGCVPGFDCYRHMVFGDFLPEPDLDHLLDVVYKDRDFVVRDA